MDTSITFGDVFLRCRLAPNTYTEIVEICDNGWLVVNTYCLDDTGVRKSMHNTGYIRQKIRDLIWVRITLESVCPELLDII